MDSTSASVHEAEKRLFTVRQQIEQLKAWNKVQEDRLTQKVSRVDQFPDKETIIKPLRERNHQKGQQRRKLGFDNLKNEIDEQPLIPAHKDFQSLLDAKLKEENSDAVIAHKSIKMIEKRKFLRKGEGLSRFRMKAEDFKLGKRSRTPKALSASTAARFSKQHAPSTDECISEKSSALEAFELLEQQTNDSSFSSSSSMVTQLMEESIKSTPIKVLNKTDSDDRPKHNAINVYGEYDFFGIRTLGVIDEEPSKYEDSSRCSSRSHAQSMGNNSCNLVIVNVSDNEKFKQHSIDEERYNSSDCSSECSCYLEEDASRCATSQNVSVFTEKTTTVYSPAKNECTREIQFYKTATEHDGDNQLKILLQSRLRELETEIDAFREENSHLTELRKNYEAEYNKFCDEKMQLLAKIRAEHLENVREIEEEKKKMQREKMAFEKYMKETKNKPNKHEKEEIRLLKEEMKLLKEELSKKESRWAAAQARIRTEMKQMKDLNSTLKDELKELKTKKVTFAPFDKKLKPPPKPIKYAEIPSSPVLNTDLVNSRNDLLQRLEFSDTKYIDKVRSLTNSLEPSSLSNSRSICVSSYLNNTQLESTPHVDVTATVEVNESRDVNGNVEKSYPDGRKEIWYPNGNLKKISPDGKVTKTIYFNGDVKEVLENEIVKYYFAESKIWHSEYGNGLKIMEFPNGQVEKHFKNGSLEITYPSGTIYEVNAKGDEKWTQVDGTVIVKSKTSNEKRVTFPNGQVEIHTPEFKRGEYPDGTVKTIFFDGRQETRYWNGRVRLKTKDGKLLSDTEIT